MFRRRKKPARQQWTTSPLPEFGNKRPADGLGGAFAFDDATCMPPSTSRTQSRITVELPVKLILLMSAGGGGTVARYLLSTAVQKFITGGFPWGTLAINVLGSFAFGFIWAVVGVHNGPSTQLRLLLLVGFMGGFTTFSSFAFETTKIFDDSGWWLAAANILMQNVFGIAAVISGIALGRLLNSLIEGVA